MVDTQAQRSGQKTRPPVVVVLGHVDHGKTKLLDTIRKTSVAEKESGGITQHIGAYQAHVRDRLITFLDTPGHEAFTAIRSRGAKVADVAILVVAADESVKPQTKEAIRIIKEGKIPFVVALNKMDREGANAQKVKQDLAAEDVLVEDWGGTVPIVEISAKEGRNIDALLDMILLVADLQGLPEDLTSPAEGVIIESHLDKQKGYVATALVQRGILKVSDWIVVGTQIGKVKSMQDFTGAPLNQALPSQPVLITGWTAAPDIGKSFKTAGVKKQADELAADNINLSPLLLFLKGQPAASGTEPKKKIFNVIFKSDVSSSLEALDASMKAIKSEEVGVSVLGYGIGNISEADVKTAASTKATIFGFRVTADESAKKLAEKEGLKIVLYDIIYELIEAVRREMADLLEPEIRRNVLGKLRVLALFKRDGRTQILGGKVTSGKIARGASVDVVRPSTGSGQAAVKAGKLNQLQHNKEDVAEVREGLEAGLRIELADPALEIKVGDVLEVYQEENIKRSL